MSYSKGYTTAIVQNFIKISQCQEYYTENEKIDVIKFNELDEGLINTLICVCIQIIWPCKLSAQILNNKNKIEKRFSISH